MAKHQGRSNARKRNFTALKASLSLALSTLGDDTIISIAGPTLTQKFDVVSTELTVALRGGTAGEGPIDYGLNQSGLTTTEVLECLDASPTSQIDVPAIEFVKRKVRLYGIFAGILTEETVNEGNPVRKRMWMPVPDGDPMPEVWFRNRSGAALTGGQIMEIQATYFGYWK